MVRVPYTVGSFLLHSYLYYHLDTSRISDHEYDQLCRELLDRWDDVQTHPHGHLISREALSAGTGHHIPESAYPNMVRHMALKAAANANYLNELQQRMEVRKVDIQFKVRGTEYRIVSDAHNVTFGKVGKPSRKTGIPAFTPIAYVGSVDSAFDRAMDYAMKSSDASDYKEAVQVLKEIKSDINAALGRVKIETKELVKPSPKPAKPEEPDDLDLDFGDDDDDLFD